MLRIANNLTSGSSLTFEYRFGTRAINVYLEGTFDNATVIVEVLSPSGNYIPVDDASFTKPGLYILSNQLSNSYRITIQDEGASTSITAYVRGQVSETQ